MGRFGTRLFRGLGRRWWLGMGRFGTPANERTKRFKHRLMVLLGIVHHAFERIEAAKPDDEFFTSQLLEALRNLIAD
jgi:hypothetical protein